MREIGFTIFMIVFCTAVAGALVAIIIQSYKINKKVNDKRQKESSS
jgi:hypothetical protein